ncbi:complement C1q subcomponent subunit A [Antennarius striatus]|uniref:complement C1q subcomponent subunit A n=1 Tax=Antennarius striatus TaxID=241820 RepID=UPI0035AE284D
MLNKRGNSVYFSQFQVSCAALTQTAIWIMGVYYGIEVLVGMALLLTSSQCNTSCQGTDGHPGEGGRAGRDGRPGAKGEKGEPAVRLTGPVDPGVMLMLKGEIGSQGKQGPMGPKGFRGVVGTAGHPGSPGPQGPDGKIIGSGGNVPEQALSAFSVRRSDHSYPAYGQKVTYQETLVNIPGDFNAATGYFTCRVPGVYYFTFQSVAKVSVCLRIASDAPFSQPGFCDYNNNSDQVLSGGVVVQLTAGQKVWLESFKDQQQDAEANDTREKQIIFNGFLVFSNSD